MLFYLLTYAVTNIGAFGVIALLENADRPNDRDRATTPGLWHDRPALAGADDGLPAVARRLSADGRLHREVVPCSAPAVKAGYTGSRSSAC